MDLIADTSLLIGIWRKQAWAVDFAMANADLSLGIPWVVAGEFRHGATRAGHDPEQVTRFLSIGIPLMETEAVVPVYAKLRAHLQDKEGYRSIGQNDLWIAAVSLTYEKPLVSRNSRHFQMIEGLELQAVG